MKKQNEDEKQKKGNGRSKYLHNKNKFYVIKIFVKLIKMFQLI